MALANTVTNLAEDASTASRIKVADIVITDDALGTNDLSLSGDDSALFEIVGTELYLSTGTVPRIRFTSQGPSKPTRYGSPPKPWNVKS